MTRSHMIPCSAADTAVVGLAAGQSAEEREAARATIAAEQAAAIP